VVPTIAAPVNEVGLAPVFVAFAPVALDPVAVVVAVPVAVAVEPLPLLAVLCGAR
jgi:hypothetical protein